MNVNPEPDLVFRPGEREWNISFVGERNPMNLSVSHHVCNVIHNVIIISDLSPQIAFRRQKGEKITSTVSFLN